MLHFIDGHEGDHVEALHVSREKISYFGNIPFFYLAQTRYCGLGIYFVVPNHTRKSHVSWDVSKFYIDEFRYVDQTVKVPAWT